MMRGQRKLNSHPALRVAAAGTGTLCAHTWETPSADWKRPEKDGRRHSRLLEQVSRHISVLQQSRTFVGIQAFDLITVCDQRVFLLTN